MKGRKMKTIITGALLAGVILTAPSFAHEVEQNSEARGMGASQNEKADPQHEALKKFVNEALDAHKNKAPKGMKGHHEEMKAYVGKALDAEKENRAQILSDTQDLNYQQSVQYLIDAASLHTAYANAGCANMDDRSPAQNQCLKGMIDNTTGSCTSLYFVLEFRCTGNHWYSGKGTCHNPNFKSACVNLADPCGWANSDAMLSRTV